MSSAWMNRSFPLSLRMRVTLWTAGVLAVSLAVALASARHNLRRVLEAKNDTFLQQKVDELEAAARESSDGEESLDAEIRREVGAYREEGMVVILERSGKIDLSPSDNVGPELVTASATARPNGSPIEVRTPDGRFRMARRATDGLSITVAISLADTERTLAQFDRRLATWALLLLAAAMGGGMLLSRMVLRPVAGSIARVRELNPADLSARLPLAGAHDELDQLAVAINKMLDRLSDYHAQVIRFTADASHELRSPLGVMRAAIEVTLQEPRTADGYRESLSSLAEQCDRLSTLVNGLLVLARADSGQLDVRREPIDLSAIAAEAAEMYEPLAEERGITLSCTNSGAALVAGDRDRLRQLISNLVDNAIKFTDPTGQVTIVVSTRDSKAILRVGDTGRGIPAAQLPHVFERFYRADSARTGDGFGLGLSICQWIADAHQGTIRVAETCARGTTMEFSLPLVTGNGANAAPAKQAVANIPR